MAKIHAYWIHFLFYYIGIGSQIKNMSHPMKKGSRKRKQRSIFTNHNGKDPMSPIVQKNFKSAVEVVRRAKDNIEKLSTTTTEKSSEILPPERKM